MVDPKARVFHREMDTSLPGADPIADILIRFEPRTLTKCEAFLIYILSDGVVIVNFVRARFSSSA